MTYISRISAAGAALALATPAFAHTGEHNANVVATIIHWASQPTHGFALLAGAAMLIAAVKLARRARG